MWRRIRAIVLAPALCLALTSACATDQTPTVPSAGCAIAVPAEQLTRDVAAAGGAVDVPVTAPASCAWTATSDAPFISVVTQSATGNSTVRLAISENTTGPRTGTVTIGSHVLTIYQAGVCEYLLSRTSISVGSAASDAQVFVSAGSPCALTTTVSSSFVHVTDAPKAGSGTVRLHIDGNPGAARSASVTIAGQTVTIDQAGAGGDAASCGVAVSPGAVDLAATGGGFDVAVTSASDCSWTAATSAGYLALNTSSGMGNRTIRVTVAANNGAARTAWVNVADRTITVNQAGAAAGPPAPPTCVFSIAPASHTFPASGGTLSAALTTDATCAWTIGTVGTSFVTATPLSGTGPATITLTAGANNGTRRTMELTIGGATMAIAQDRVQCTGTLQPNSQTFSAAGGSAQIQVNMVGGCTWSVASVPPWITLTSPATSSGTVLSFSVAPNDTGATRHATVVVEGLPLTVTQTFAVPSNSSYLTFKGDSSDYLTGGRSYLFTLNDTAFTVDSTVRITATRPGNSSWWYLTLVAPNGAPLTVGTYSNATRWPFQAAGVPGLDLSGDGRGCNVLTGSFVVSEVAYAPNGSLDRLRATFEEHCEAGSAAVRGEVFILNNPLR